MVSCKNFQTCKSHETTMATFSISQLRRIEQEPELGFIVASDIPQLVEILTGVDISGNHLISIACKVSTQKQALF